MYNKIMRHKAIRHKDNSTFHEWLGDVLTLLSQIRKNGDNRAVVADWTQMYNRGAWPETAVFEATGNIPLMYE